MTPSALLALKERGAAFKADRMAGTSPASWRVVAAGSVVQVVVGGLLLHAYGAYVVALRREFGWSQTVLAAGYSMLRVESGLLGPLQGWLIDTFGARRVIRIGLLTLGIGFIGFSQVNSIWSFFAWFFVMAFGASLASWFSVMIAIVHEFRDKRAAALSVAKLGGAVAGIVVPVVTAALGWFGWRPTAISSGILILLLTPLLVRNLESTPAVRRSLRSRLPGRRRDRNGSEEPPTGDTVTPASITSEGPGTASVSEEGEEGDKPALHAADTADDEPSYTTAQAIRTRAFWCLSVGHALAVLVVSATMVHLIPFLTDTFAYSLSAAGGIVALVSGMQLGGIMVGGLIGDRLDKRLIVAACLLLHGLGLLMLTYAINVLMVLAFTMLHGMAWGARGPLIQALRADYFGRRSFGTIAGYSSLVVMLGTTSGPIIAGYFYDRLGDYQVGFTTLALAAIAGSTLFLAAPRLPNGSANGLVRP